MRWLAALLICVSFPASTGAQEVVADMSQERVAITANFDGSEILIFGAIKGGYDEDAGMDVIITVEGPSTPVMVRKKDRRAGIWVNTEAVEVDRAPAIYKIATTRTLSDILSETEDLRHKITIPRAIRSVGAPEEVEDAASFTDALIRIRKDLGLYRIAEGSVKFNEGALFSTNIALPANLVEGDYRARIFLTQQKQIVADYETAIEIRKVGLERWLYTLAHDRPLAYGLLSIAIAIAAGWGASAIFVYLRG